MYRTRYRLTYEITRYVFGALVTRTFTEYHDTKQAARNAFAGKESEYAGSEITRVSIVPELFEEKEA